MLYLPAHVSVLGIANLVFPETDSRFQVEKLSATHADAAQIAGSGVVFEF